MSVVSQLKVHGAPLRFAPEVFAAELSEWINLGEAPDNDLLAAILRNDLHGAIALTADYASWRLIRETLIWLVNFAPIECFGSVDNVRIWMDRGGAEGRPMRRKQP
jgi:hypothetical protein